MSKLKLADDLSLPIDAATRRLAILAMSGAGKSNVAVVLAEQMFDAGIPWVAIDPKGDWWGIRSSKSGKGPGLSVPIFGGLHADVKIDPTAAAGAELATVIADERLTCVVDISEFTDRQAMWGFMAAFGDALLHRNRQALHLFLEEADEYLPQKTSEKGNLPRCLGVWQRVVKRGRFRGIGSTQITQRNAALNKDTLYQAECLIALRSTGKGDRDAVKGWVEYHAAAAEIVDSLPTLADGEGWVSSPAWIKKTARVQFNRRQTFDSGATPVMLDGSSSKAATLATIDLGAIQKRMHETIEKAKADDPRELKKQLAAAKAELAAKNKTLDQVDVQTKRIEQKLERVKPVEKFVLKDGQLARAEGLLTTIGNEIARHEAFVKGRLDLLRELTQEIAGAIRQTHTPTPLTTPRPSPHARGVAPGPAPAVRPRPARVVSPPASSNGNVTLGKAERAILTVLAQHEDGCDKGKLTILTRYRYSGGFRNSLSTLRTAGYLVGGNDEIMRITDQGREALGEVDQLPTGSALASYWLSHSSFGKAERAILDALLKNPDGLTSDQLCQVTGYEFSGGFRNSLSVLRTAGVLVGKNSDVMRASDELFD